jgi:hypothetical protein
MRALAIGALAVLCAAAVAVYGTLLLVVLAAIRDWLHSRRQIRRMRRSGEPARHRTAMSARSVTWVLDDDGNAIASDGNSFTIHAKQ